MADTYDYENRTPTKDEKRIRDGEYYETIQSFSSSTANATSMVSLLPPRMPYYIRQLPEIHNALNLPWNQQFFSNRFLQDTLGGESMAPGIWYGKPPQPLARVWRAMNSALEPYLPPGPGHHCAKLTAFPPLQQSKFAAPLFVSVHPGRYFYYGQYKVCRVYDRLDYDRMMEVISMEIKEFWAEYLGNEVAKPHPNMDLILEMKEDLIERKQLTSTVSWGRVRLNELPMKALKSMDRAAFMKAFENPDAGHAPSLRLALEYLECVDYDMDFYEELVWRKFEPVGYF